jgi:hypothetical protein
LLQQSSLKSFFVEAHKLRLSVIEKKTAHD